MLVVNAVAEEVDAATLIAVVTEALYVITGIVFQELAIDVLRLQQHGDAVSLLEIIEQVRDLIFQENVSEVVAEALAYQGAECGLLKTGNEVWSHFDRAKKAAAEAAFYGTGIIRGYRLLPALPESWLERRADAPASH